MFAPRLLLASLFVVFAAAKPQAAGFHFDGLPWGASKAEVVKTITAAGFHDVKQATADGDLTADGRMDGVDVRAFFSMAEGKLASVIVIMKPDRSAYHPFYDRMRKQLIDEYGAPTETHADVSDEVRKNPSLEAAAIREYKANFMTKWEGAGAAAGQSVGVAIGDDLRVVIVYTSPLWDAELERRQQVATRGTHP